MRAPTRQDAGRRHARQAIIGMLMLPLSLIPFGMYLSGTQEGALVWAKVYTRLRPPRAPRLSAADRDWAQKHRPRYKGAVAVLVYHGVGKTSSAEGSDRFTLTPEQFGGQLAMLEAAGFTTVTATEVALAYAGLGSLPRNAVMISFDDGRTDAMLHADPILESLGMRATMFTIARAASEPGVYYASWDRLRRFHRSGRWDIQSHTKNMHREHAAQGGRELPAMTSLAPDEDPAAYRERVAGDLRRASAAIEKHIGIPPLAFAYPFGAYGASDDERQNHHEVASVVRDEVGARYINAFHQDRQDEWRPQTCDGERLGMPRLEVGAWSGRALVDRIARLSEPSGRCTRADAAFRAQRLPAGLMKLARRVARLTGSRILPVEQPSGLATGGDGSGACGVAGASCRPGDLIPEIPVVPGVTGVPSVGWTRLVPTPGSPAYGGPVVYAPPGRPFSGGSTQPVVTQRPPTSTSSPPSSGTSRRPATSPTTGSTSTPPPSKPSKPPSSHGSGGTPQSDNGQGRPSGPPGQSKGGGGVHRGN